MTRIPPRDQREHESRDQQPYQDLGPHFFEQIHDEIVRSSTVLRLVTLGYRVTLEDRNEHQEVANEQGAQAEHEIFTDE